MKRIVVVYSGGRQWGGIETYLANLFRLYDRSQMRLYLASLGEWDLTRELEGQGLSDDLRILSARRIRPMTVVGLKRVIGETEADLIVSQGVVANAYARSVAMITGVPNLTVLHSYIDLDYPRVLARWVYKLSDRLLRLGTSSYIAVSGYLKDQAVRSGVDADKICVVYNGSAMLAGSQAGKAVADGDDHAEQVESSSSAKEVRRSTSGVELVSAGRLHPVKNYDSLVKAMLLLPDDTNLTIWGEGGERSYLEGMVEELGLSGRVRLPGEFEDMSEALEGADIYLQPSKSEGFGLAVTEAMLHGKPVVVAPYGGLVEQVEDRVTGIVAADGTPEGLAGAVRVLLEDRALTRRLAAAGKAAATEVCSVEKWLANTTAAFCDAADRAVRRP